MVTSCKTVVPRNRVSFVPAVGVAVPGMARAARSTWYWPSIGMVHVIAAAVPAVPVASVSSAAALAATSRDTAAELLDDFHDWIDPVVAEASKGIGSPPGGS